MKYAIISTVLWSMVIGCLAFNPSAITVISSIVTSLCTGFSWSTFFGMGDKGEQNELLGKISYARS